MVEEKYFEDFKVGERFKIPSRTITETHYLLFSALTGDNHPIHYDEEYCKKTVFGRRVAHGLLLASLTALGASDTSFATENSVLAFAEQWSRFLKPVFIGDTLAPILEVTELIPKGKRGIMKVRCSITNQRGELVLEGGHTYFMKCRSN
jgi:acyl dehydratase